MNRHWIPSGASAAVLLTLSSTATRGATLTSATQLHPTNVHTALYRLRTAGYVTRTGTHRATTWTRTRAGDTVAPLAQAGLTPNAAFILNLATDHPQTLTPITRASAHNGGPRWRSEVHIHLTALVLADLLTVQGCAYTLTPAGQHLQATTRALFGEPTPPPMPEVVAPAHSRPPRPEPLKHRILTHLQHAPAQATDLHAHIPDHTIDVIRSTLTTMHRAGLVTSTRTGRAIIWSAA